MLFLEAALQAMATEHGPQAEAALAGTETRRCGHAASAIENKSAKNWAFHGVVSTSADGRNYEIPRGIAPSLNAKS